MTKYELVAPPIGDPIMRRIDNTGNIRPDATTRLHPTKDIVHKPE